MEEEKNEKNPIEIEPILQVEKLVKSYGKRVVVNELSFIVNPGECYCLLVRMVLVNQLLWIVLSV